MNADYRRDVRWLAAREAYATPDYETDPGAVFARQVLAARDMHEIERQYAAARESRTADPTSPPA